MKEFFMMMRRFVPPYKRYLVMTIVFNLLSAVMNIFSFATLIPILQILFQTGETERATAPMAWGSGDAKEVLTNNANYYVQQIIDTYGATTTLLLIGILLSLLTLIKTGM